MRLVNVAAMTDTKRKAKGVTPVKCMRSAASQKGSVGLCRKTPGLVQSFGGVGCKSKAKATTQKDLRAADFGIGELAARRSGKNECAEVERHRRIDLDGEGGKCDD